MFAVIKTGGKQYRVAADDTITVMSLPGNPGEVITLNEVLMVADGANTDVGAPFVAGASVGAEIVEQARGPKVIAFKKRRRQNSKRKRGHRQDLTLLRITGIGLGGAAPERRAAQASSHELPDATAAQEGAAQPGEAQPGEQHAGVAGDHQVDLASQTELHEAELPAHSQDPAHGIAHES